MAAAAATTEEETRAATAGWKKIQSQTWRLELPWRIAGSYVPVDVYLVLEKPGSWVLVDTGLRAHYDVLVEAVRQAIGTGHLSRIYVTHGHLDHVGGLRLLMNAFQSARAVIHRAERPFIFDVQKFNELKGDRCCSLFQCFKKYLTELAMEDRLNEQVRSLSDPDSCLCISVILM
jgi:glyoxylase-like metal-dependent hydrolase (beta-lactamase superfamily II)